MKKRLLKTDDPVEALPLNTALFAPGERVCVAVSGGVDSTGLLRALLARRAELGLVLSVLHVEHGLRGAAAARDAEFVSALAEKFSLPWEVIAVDTPKRAAEQKESIEEAARNLRYQVFRETLACGKADKIATAHTLDDQAETVLMKLLRGAWTEGLSGIHPLLRFEETGGVCVRPLLGSTRAQIEAYMRALGQPWREDETNDSLLHTRNRVRHELLPILREYNPQIAETLARMAANARSEEEHWKAELARLLPQLLLPGKPVRGGGRSVPTGPETAAVALELKRLQALDPGLRRRVLRAAAGKCGATLDFEATERLLSMVESKPSAASQDRSAKRLELPGGVRVERSARELQFERRSPETKPSPTTMAYELLVPGTVEAPAFRARYTATIESAGESVGGVEGNPRSQNRDLRHPVAAQWPSACVRAWEPGDRVELAYSHGPKRVKEVLQRMGIRGEERATWPVVCWQGRIVWMRGVAVAGVPASAGNEAGLLSNLRVQETPL